MRVDFRKGLVRPEKGLVRSEKGLVCPEKGISGDHAAPRECW
jgi:hypothetical protein